MAPKENPGTTEYLERARRLCGKNHETHKEDVGQPPRGVPPAECSSCRAIARALTDAGLEGGRVRHAPGERDRLRAQGHLTYLFAVSLAEVGACEGPVHPTGGPCTPCQARDLVRAVAREALEGACEMGHSERIVFQRRMDMHVPCLDGGRSTQGCPFCGGVKEHGPSCGMRDAGQVRGGKW